MLATLYPLAYTQHSSRFSKDIRYENKLNVDGIIYPVSRKSVDSFKEKNPTSSINLYRCEDNKLLPFILLETEKGNTYQPSLVIWRKWKDICVNQKLDSFELMIQQILVKHMYICKQHAHLIRLPKKMTEKGKIKLVFC